MTGATNRISYNPAGGMFDLLSFIPAISGDGRYVAFVSSVLYPEILSGAENFFGSHDGQPR
jgi:hypothetical protein